MRLRKYDYKTITSATRDTIGKGSHPFHYELLYIVSGKTKLQSLGESYETEGRALFIIPPGTPHHLMKASPHYSFLYIELEVSPSETFIPLNQLVVWNRLQTSCGSEHKWIANVYRIWDDICSFLHSEVAENSEVLEEVCVLDIQKTLALMRFTVEQADHLNQPADKRLSIGNEHASPKAIVEALARLLESHYMYNLTMQSLCERAHFTPSYLIRLFKEHTGMTPFQYLDKVRTSAALSYLANNNMSIQEIVEATGYQSIHYFSRLFKQKLGMSPTEWRNKRKQEKRVAEK